MWETFTDGRYKWNNDWIPKHLAKDYQSDTFWAPCMFVPKEDPFWYEPMGKVDLELGQTVEFVLYDGTGRYYRGTVLEKRKGIEEGVWEYKIGRDTQLRLF